MGKECLLTSRENTEQAMKLDLLKVVFDHLKENGRVFSK